LIGGIPKRPLNREGGKESGPIETVRSYRTGSWKKYTARRSGPSIASVERVRPRYSRNGSAALMFWFVLHQGKMNATKHW